MTASRYQDDADQIAETFASDDNDEQAHCSAAIVDVIKKYVQHDTEWCAVAADELAQKYRRDMDSHVLSMTVAQQLETLAASYRMRGRLP